MSKLKEDFPGFAALDAAGEATDAKVRKRIADGTLTEIPGIGESAAARIEAAVAKADGPTGSDTDAPEPTDETAADVQTEAEAQAKAINPALVQAEKESNAEKLAHSRFCFYDDPEGPFVANADTITPDDLSSKRVQITPISMKAPAKGMEIRDSGDVYVITEDMMAENTGDWLKVRSPVTGLSLIR